MDHTNVFFAKDRAAFRDWLAANFESARDVWLVFPTKASGEQGVSYNDAVEEALCFGWIDSTTGKLDDLHGIRRFTKRRPGASYSRPNIERLLWLDKRGMILPSVKASLGTLLTDPYVFPPDILAKIAEDEETARNFAAFSAPYKRIRVAYIEAARSRPAEFEKRLASFLAKTKAGKKIVGFGGVEKYYDEGEDAAPC